MQVAVQRTGERVSARAAILKYPQERWCRRDADPAGFSRSAHGYGSIFSPKRSVDMRGDGELTIAKIEAAIAAILTKGSTKRVLLYDGAGLWLQLKLTRDGKRVGGSWVFRYPAFIAEVGTAGKLYRKQLQMGFGAYPKLDLAMARQVARESAVLIARGLNPRTERDKKRAEQQPAPEVPTFSTAARLWLKNHETEWSNEKYACQVAKALLDYVYSVKIDGRAFGELRVDEIDTPHVCAVLNRLWRRPAEGGKPQLADRIRGRIEAVLGLAGAQGWRGSPAPPNPARWPNHLEHIFTPVGKLVPTKNHGSVDPADIATFMAALRTMEGVDARALEFLVLTAVRTGSILDATWSQIDWQGHVWRIPDTKTGEFGKPVPQWVPMTDAMYACLMQIGVPINPAERIFSITDHAMHSLCQSICRALRLPPATPHGMRATFRTWGSAVRQDTVLIEAALSHAIGNDVYRAYDRREKHCNLLDHRWPVMRAWCDFVGKPYNAPAKLTRWVSNVVPFLRVAS
jgi:integrase